MKRNPEGTTTFYAGGVAYIVRECTAIAACDTGLENMRQNALYVGCHLNWEYVEKVVFGYSMPESDADFADMCADSDAWESEYNVLRSIRYW